MKSSMLVGSIIAVAAGAMLTAQGEIMCFGDSTAIRVNMPLPTTVNKAMIICAGAWGAGECVTVKADGVHLFSTTNQSEKTYRWQPLTLGNHKLTCVFGTTVLTKTLNVTALDFSVEPSPKPPMSKNNNISITPTTRNFGVEGGGNSIITSGSGTWTAAVSDPWITLNTTSGSVGYPVAYTVSANTNVEQRTGYVYVSGWVHTVTQDGVGGTISPSSENFESPGGKGTISVSAANKMVWQARSNVNWINISPTSGAGAGSVTYQVAPYAEVSTRQGTLTVAGNTFTVFQYGRRMKLDSYSVTKDYEAHVIPISVDALAITQWSVTPNNTWISVVDAGSGQGGDLVTIAIAENPSYKARTGTVTIGTETFTVTQQRRTALSFKISPTASTASVNGANGMIAVTATPDLPWTATSGANWLTIYAATANGAGNGNVVYSASPNPTLSKRTGKITVTPESASGVAAKTHTVTQPAATAALSSSGYEFVAAGESCSVEVSCASIVQWSISESLDWLTVNGSTSRTGPGKVVLQAAANNTVYPRSGKVTIAGKTFNVSQKARGVELEYDTKIFGTDGGYESVSIHPDGNVSWTAVASDATWITIFQGDSGTGDGEIMYVVAPYVGDGSSRTGWIEVGDKKVYITQRAYELSVSPNGSVVKGNNGAGEFGVSANIGAVWTAIVTEPWITLVSGYDAGTGSGTVRFICEDNNTGRPRIGKIVVAGEVYTITQSARILVQIQATAGRGGSLTGSGTYDKGEKIVLTAIPDSGYRFVRWTGPVSSTDNPLVMDADDIVGIRAEFEPMPIDFTAVSSSIDGVDLSWNTLAWAMTYRLYRGESDNIAAATELATFPNGAVGAYRDETGERGVTYWYWVAAIGDEDDVVSMSASGMRKPIVNSPITYENLMGATHSNPDTYVEGREVTFSHPSTLRGYTFSGWTPPKITKEMTGAQKVRASWAANRYSIVYNANGGSGTMETTAAMYDQEVEVAANEFSRVGHSFAGWATNATGEVVFVTGQPVTNLTETADEELTFFAVWSVNHYTVTFDANGGTGGKTVTQDYGTALSAPAVTRTGYTFDGWSPAVPAAVPAGNATYVAQWSVNQYTVTFDANGGNGGWSKSMDYGATITAPTVTRTGYTFTGWSPAVPATVPAGNVTYTAQWKINQYTVTFDANGGTGGKTVTQDYGTALSAPTVTRTGYTFTGWSPAVPATVPAGNATYRAQWTKNQYTVTFDANGGTGGKTVTQDYGTALSAPTVTRTGYTFTGWSPAVPATVPAGNMTYTAQWKINQYTVTFDANGGTGGKTVTQNYGTELSAPAVTREGYTFDGWSPSVPATVPAANATYTAQWTKNKYTVTFNANGGNGGWSRAMDYGAAITAPTVTRTGYTFTGWSPAVASTVPAGNVTYTAQWKINQYTVTFDANGGTGGKTVTQDYGTALSAPTVTRTGYTFTGWSPSVPATVPAANVTYTAQWQLNRHTVTFDANGGTGGSAGCGMLTTNAWTLLSRDSDGTEEYRSPSIGNSASSSMLLTLTGPCDLTFSWKVSSESGYDYLRWYLDGTEKAKISGTGGTWKDVSVSVPAGEHTVKWTYSKDGGSASGSDCGWVRVPKITPPVSLDYGQAVGELPTPTRTGYTFKGWFTAASGGTQISASTVVTSDVTYYAHWAVNQYTVTFDANGGTGGKTVTQDYGMSLSAPTVTREGYTLDCWSPSVPSTVPAANATYTAQWTKNQYTVTFDANGGEGGWSKSMDYGATITAPTVTRTGYTFAGWSPAVASTVPTGNVTYTAQWKVNQYTVTFDANGGNGGWSKSMDYGAAITAPTVTRTGYTFTGWSPAVASTVPAGNVTYTAQWKANGSVITFDAQGGSLGSASTTKPVAKGKTIGELPTPTRTGYAFAGWWTAKSGGVEVKTTTKVAEDATYYARWTANTYKIKFNKNGGKGKMKTLSATYDKNVRLTANAFKRTGYKFAGWATTKNGKVAYKNKAKVKNLTATNGETVAFYAVWEPCSYKIKFDKNGGKGTMKTLSATYGKNVKLTANTFKRTGYKFAGWAKKKNGKVAYKNKAKVKNLTAKNGKTVTLYAVWKKSKSGDVKAAATAAKPAASAAKPAAVPTWAVGTFYGSDEGAFTTITVSKTGKVSGKVLFADGRCTIVGKASGQCLETVVTDADGNSAEVVFAIVKTPDGRCRIKSEDGTISAEN